MVSNTVYEGCQINLDKGEANPSGNLVDDIRNSCTELNVSFESRARCFFNGTSKCYFRYRGIDWVPANYKEEVTQNKTYKYNISACPRYFFEFVEDVSEDTRSFAKSIGVEPTQTFENIKLICPLRNRFAIELINDYRKQFMQEAYKKQDMSSSMLLYLSKKEMLSITFGKWMNNDALPLDSTLFQANTSFISFFNDQPSNEISSYRSASHWKGIDYLQKMLGRVFEIHGTSAFIFLGRYSLKLNGSNEFDDDTAFMCVRTEELLGEMSGFSSAFAEIKYVYK